MADHPGWPFKVPEATARWLNCHRVTAIRYEWEMIDSENARDWLVLVSLDKEELKVPTGCFSIYPEVEFKPMSSGLVHFKSWINVPQQIQAIDAWKRKEQHDLSEFRRLRKKFEGMDMGDWTGEGPDGVTD